MAQRIICEQNFKNTEAERDSFIVQLEALSKEMAAASQREEAAKKDIEELPAQIEALKAKMVASVKLLTPDAAMGAVKDEMKELPVLLDAEPMVTEPQGEIPVTSEQ